MARNGKTGDGHRNGAVKERSQTYNPKTDSWVKRDAETGRFMDGKSDDEPFKGVRKEKWNNIILFKILPRPGKVTDILIFKKGGTMYLNKYNNTPNDKVRLCKGNLCIEARGENARLLTGVFAIALLCIGIAALSRA